MEKRINDMDLFASPPFKNFKSAGYYDHAKPWSWHSKCDYACFYCVTRGKITVSDRQNVIVAQEGDVLFLRSTDEMLMQCSDERGNAYYFVSFYYDESVDLMIDTYIRDAGVTNLFGDIYEAHRSLYNLGRFKLYTIFIRLVYALCSKTLKADKSYSDTYHIRSTAEYINLNCTKKISTSELCKISGYSPAHLRRLFIKHYSLSPRDYIIKCRIEMAKEMLVDMPSKTTEEISSFLGMCSPSYFCKIFKERTGLTPTEYKEKHII